MVWWIIKHDLVLKIFLTGSTVKPMDSLAVLKAIGDETRYEMYRELATATHALTAAELADRLGLHANTVRLHLERMRDAGLVEVEAVHRGTVGRPQHVYSLVAGSPTVGFDPPAHALLAGLMAALAEHAGADGEDAAAAGRAYGKQAARNHQGRSCSDALMTEMSILGFDPALETGAADATLFFLQCPFRELAEAYPELVCNLHRGICEGVVGAVRGGNIEQFHALYDHTPCQADLTVG
jgi:predicted ArsR family transcriptional regulator